CAIFGGMTTMGAIGFFQGYQGMSESFNKVELAMLIPVFIFGGISAVFWLVLLYYLPGLLMPRAPKLQRASGQIVIGNRGAGDTLNREIEIGGKQFKVDSALANLIAADKTYTVYYPDNANRILSIEEGIKGWNVSASEGKKTPLEYEADLLKTLFKFTDDDMRENQRGVLSDSQKTRLGGNARTGIGCIVFFLAIGGFVGSIIAATTSNLPVAAGIGGVIFLVLLMMSLNGSRNQLREINQGVVKKTSGIAAVETTQHRTTGENAHTVTNYYVTIGDVRFQVQEDEYYAFKEGRTYNVYYLDSSSTPILSAEQLS
ncbi:MAG TPA: hypothetical protein VHL11_25100, partial [Phototrophicaceae bacterium]|nr:hypothetical protein [Phototrophicaceae bacterium]